MKKTGIIVLAVILILIAGVELFLFLQMKGLIDTGGAPTGGQTAAAPMTESPAVTAVPPPSAAPATDTPEPTATAEPTATPTPAPTQGPPPTLVPVTPTPPPTAEPTPTAAPSLTGSCSSDTGTELDMTVEWRTEDLGSGMTRVHITGTVSSYSLDLGRTSVTVALGDQSTTYRVESLHVGRNDRTVSDLFTAWVDVPAGKTYPLQVDWNAHVTYGGVFLKTVTAADDVTA